MQDLGALGRAFHAPSQARWKKVPGAIRVVILYGALIAGAETIASYLPGPNGTSPSPDGVILGMVLHTITLFALLTHASLAWTRGNQALSGFMASLSVIPLIRIFSLSVPFFRFTMIEWLFIISTPLLFSAISMARILNLTPAQLGLRRLPLRDIPFQVALGALGIPLGLAEFLILRPSQAWIPALTAFNLLVGAAAISLASGVAEELIFRGILLNQTLQVTGPRAAVLVVTLLFTVMHIGFLSFVDLAYVFCVGLLFATMVLKTKTLYGVIACHSLANIVLYALAPFFW